MSKRDILLAIHNFSKLKNLRKNNARILSSQKFLLILLFVKMIQNVNILFQWTDTNACKTQNGNCSQLCLPTGNNQRLCVCTAGYQRTNDTYCVGRCLDIACCCTIVVWYSYLMTKSFVRMFFIVMFYFHPFQVIKMMYFFFRGDFIQITKMLNILYVKDLIMSILIFRFSAYVIFKVVAYHTLFNGISTCCVELSLHVS